LALLLLQNGRRQTAPFQFFEANMKLLRQMNTNQNMNGKENALARSETTQLSGRTDQKSGLRLQFRDAPIHSVLSYFHEAAGLAIEVERSVEIERTVELWTDELVSREEAIALLTEALDDKGYAAVRKGHMLAIIPLPQAKKHVIPLPTLGCSAFAG
jgi:type II secretory pathway component GspD/PulD (secretin)